MFHLLKYGFVAFCVCLALIACESKKSDPDPARGGDTPPSGQEDLEKQLEEEKNKQR